MTATLFAANGTFSGRQWRQALSVFGVMGSSSRPLGALSGVRPGTPTTTVSATSTTWTVAPHAGLIDAEAAAEAGPYPYSIDANITGSVTAADASNARIDLISIQVSDNAEDGTGATGSASVAAVYTAGTASASPTPPETPARSLAIAQINVPKAGGGSPTVTWLAPWVGPRPAFQTLAQLNAWTPADPRQSARVLADPTAFNGDYVRSGSTWLFRGDTGWVNMSPSGSGVTLTGAQARIKDGVLYLQGTSVKSSNWAANDAVAFLPLSISSQLTRSMRVSAWFGNAVATVLNTSGQSLILGGTSGTSSQTINFGNGGPID